MGLNIKSPNTVIWLQVTQQYSVVSFLLQLQWILPCHHKSHETSPYSTFYSSQPMKHIGNWVIPFLYLINWRCKEESNLIQPLKYWISLPWCAHGLSSHTYSLCRVPPHVCNDYLSLYQEHSTDQIFWGWKD